MSLTRRVVIAAPFAAALGAGCASTSAVTGEYKSVGTYAVTLNRQWSDMTNAMLRRPENVRMLSIDGPLLNRFYLASLMPGQSMIRLADRDTPIPTYRTDMSDSEIVEFVVDCVAAMQFQSPSAAALRPQQFVGAPGIRFDIATRTSEGLNISGAALAARRNDRLNVMLFLAPSEYYYGALLPDVEAAFASARAA
jgi:hypothetical protein